MCIEYDSGMVRSADASDTTRRRFYRARSVDALADAVRSVRGTTGKTQDDVAQAVRSSRPTISRMERGLPTATDTLLDVLTECGYEIVVVPRGALVTVEVPA